MSRWPCKDHLKGTCNTPFCEKWHPPECLFHKTKSGCRFGEKCSCTHRQVDEQPTKRSNKNDDKRAVAMLKKDDWHERRPVTDQGRHDRSGQLGKKRGNEMERRSSKHRSSNARQLGCVFQDMTPLKSILRKSTDVQRPIQCVRFTKFVARHAKIRDQNPSLGFFFAQVNLISVAPTLQNLRIGLRRRQSGTRGRDKMRLATKAGRATVTAVRSPRPPTVTPVVACHQE